MGNSSLLPVWTALRFLPSELQRIRRGPLPENESQPKKSEKRCATPKKGMTLLTTAIPDLSDGAAVSPSGRTVRLPARLVSVAFRRAKTSSWPPLQWNWYPRRSFHENTAEYGRLTCVNYTFLSFRAKSRNLLFG